MGKIFTGLVSGLIRTFSHRMTTEWEVPYENGPCVFVANYYGAIGPLEMCVKFPLRDQCHPWINEEMLEARKAPSYIRKDYWWKPGTVFEPLLKVTVPYIAAAVLGIIVNGGIDENGRAVFSPNDPVTYAQAAVMLNNVLAVTDVSAESYEDYPAWAAQAVANLVSCNIIEAAADHTGSAAELSRADAAEMLLGAARLLESRGK